MKLQMDCSQPAALVSQAILAVSRRSDWPAGRYTVPLTVSRAAIVDRVDPDGHRTSLFLVGGLRMRWKAILFRATRLQGQLARWQTCTPSTYREAVSDAKDNGSASSDMVSSSRNRGGVGRRWFSDVPDIAIDSLTTSTRSGLTLKHSH